MPKLCHCSKALSYPISLPCFIFHFITLLIEWKKPERRLKNFISGFPFAEPVHYFCYTLEFLKIPTLALLMSHNTIYLCKIAEITGTSFCFKQPKKAMNFHLELVWYWILCASPKASRQAPDEIFENVLETVTAWRQKKETISQMWQHLLYWCCIKIVSATHCNIAAHFLALNWI